MCSTFVIVDVRLSELSCLQLTWSYAYLISVYGSQNTVVQAVVQHTVIQAVDIGAFAFIFPYT